MSASLPAPTSRPAGAGPTRRHLLRATALAGSALLVPGVTGCAKKAAPPVDGPVQLSVFWWGGDERADLTERALRLYTRRNPNVTFRTTWQGATGYYDRLATQAIGGNVPDLLQIDDGHLSEYAQRRILLDLTDFVARDRIRLGSLPAGLVDYGRVGGRTVAVAAASDTPALIYNRDLLRRLNLPEPRISMPYDAFLRWAATVTQRSDGRVAGTIDPSADYKVLWLWLRTHGKELYHGQQIGCTAEDLTRWWELWRGARTRRATLGSAAHRGAESTDPAEHPIVTGRVATVFAWSDELSRLQRHTRDELALVCYPGAPEAHWERAPMYWAAYHGTRHPETVADVIDFLTNEVEVGQILGNERGVNANLNVRRSVEQTLTDPGLRRTAAYANAMSSWFGPTPLPPPSGHGKVQALLATAAADVRSGRRTSRTASVEFVARANATLAN